MKRNRMDQFHRDLILERNLQETLDKGHSVWIVGDIHGYLEEFQELLAKLELSHDDMVLCLGDLIDRGPDSQGVLSMVRDSDQIFSIKGNHEHIMSEALSNNGHRNDFWTGKIGGRATLESMGATEKEQIEKATEWTEFTDRLPTEVILRRFRFTHSGYSLGTPLDEQTDEQRLKSREVFRAKAPLDPIRQIVAGHTPVQMLTNFDVDPPLSGIWKSPVRLKDGRASAVLIDTGIVLRDPGYRPRITAYELRTERIEEVERIGQIRT
ncbi:MAG: hypothetical protein CMB67_00315 [Euryarchaeota archaeon]|nr:hypothetical protein [Euryarchaeota archaeon]